GGAHGFAVDRTRGGDAQRRAARVGGLVRRARRRRLPRFRRALQSARSAWALTLLLVGGGRAHQGRGGSAQPAESVAPRRDHVVVSASVFYFHEWIWVLARLVLAKSI